MSNFDGGCSAKSAGISAAAAQTQISSNIDRLFRALANLESNGVELGERIQHILRPNDVPTSDSDKEQAYDCPLAETLASQARRIEGVASLLNNLRFRVEL